MQEILTLIAAAYSSMTIMIMTGLVPVAACLTVAMMLFHHNRGTVTTPHYIYTLGLSCFFAFVSRKSQCSY